MSHFTLRPICAQCHPALTLVVMRRLDPLWNAQNRIFATRPICAQCHRGRNKVQITSERRSDAD